MPEEDELDEQAKALGIEDTEANFESTVADGEVKTSKSEEPKVEPKEDKIVPKEEPAPAFRRIKQAEKQKSKIEEVEERLESKFNLKLDEILNAVKTAKTSEAKEEAKDELDLYVEKHGVDKTQVQELVNLIGKKFTKEPEKAEKVEAFDASVAKVTFNNEWTEFAEARIAEEFPEATYSQVSKAKSKMYELAHSEKFHTQTLGQIFDQSKDAFKNDVFFQPKGKSAESSRHSEDKAPTLDPLNDDDINSVDDAVKAQEALDKLVDDTPEYVHRGGVKYKI